MKFGVVNKSTTVNRFVLHTLQRNITHLAVITRKTNIKLGILKGGGELEKSQKVSHDYDFKTFCGFKVSYDYDKNFKIKIKCNVWR